MWLRMETYNLNIKLENSLSINSLIEEWCKKILVLPVLYLRDCWEGISTIALLQNTHACHRTRICKRIICSDCKKTIVNSKKVNSVNRI